MACCCCQGPGICCNGTDCSSVNACECGANGGTFRKGASLTCNPVICQDGQGNQTIANNPCACTGTNVCNLGCMPRPSVQVQMTSGVAPELNATRTLQLVAVGNTLIYQWGEEGSDCVFCDPCNRFTPPKDVCQPKDIWVLNVMHPCTSAPFGGIGAIYFNGYTQVPGLDPCPYCGSSFEAQLPWRFNSPQYITVQEPLWWCSGSNPSPIETGAGLNRMFTFYGSVGLVIST